MRLSGKNNLIIPTIQVQPFRSIRREQVSDRYLGVTGYLGIFVCSMGLVTLATPEQLPWIGILSLLTTLFVYPKILRRFVSWNRVLLLGLMIIPPLFLKLTKLSWELVIRGRVEKWLSRYFCAL